MSSITKTATNRSKAIDPSPVIFTLLCVDITKANIHSPDLIFVSPYIKLKYINSNDSNVTKVMTIDQNDTLNHFLGAFTILSVTSTIVKKIKYATNCHSRTTPSISFMVFLLLPMYSHFYPPKSSSSSL